MDKLTVNQIIVLLNIFRGTEELDKNGGTYVLDTLRLRDLGMIMFCRDVKNKDGFEITVKGSDYVNKIKII